MFNLDLEPYYDLDIEPDLRHENRKWTWILDLDLGSRLGLSN